MSLNTKEREIVHEIVHEIARMLFRSSENDLYWVNFGQNLPDQISSISTIHDLFDHIDEGTIAETTNATPTEIFRVAVPEDYSGMAVITGVSRRPSDDEAAGWQISAMVKNVGGTVTVVSEQEITPVGSSPLSGLFAEAMEDTGDLIVKMTGLAATVLKHATDVNFVLIPHSA